MGIKIGSGADVPVRGTHKTTSEAPSATRTSHTTAHLAAHDEGIKRPANAEPVDEPRWSAGDVAIAAGAATVGLGVSCSSGAAFASLFGVNPLWGVAVGALNIVVLAYMMATNKL